MNVRGELPGGVVGRGASDLATRWRFSREFPLNGAAARRPGVGSSDKALRRWRVCPAALPALALLGGLAGFHALAQGEPAATAPGNPAADAPASDPSGVVTGDSQNSPRNAIPWLREALDGREAEGGASAPGPGGADAAAPPVTDVFGGLFRGSLDGERQEPPAEAPEKLRESAPVASDPRINPRGAAAAPAPIEVAKMKAVDGSSAGLLSPQEAGLPTDGWRGVEADQAQAAIAGLKPGPFRNANLLAIRTLSAGLAAPRNAAGPDFLTARIEALSRFGAARQAAQLAEAAGPDLIGLGADAALVSGEEAGLCATLTSRPDDSMARIYCQALGGDAMGAALAIEATRALGQSDEATLSLIEAVAEPALAQSLGAKVKNAEPTPLRLAAQRIIGVAPPADFARDAPLTLLPAALSDKAPPRLRLEALERLEMSGAIETSALAEAFAAHASAESGGVWGRVEAYRKALEAADAAFGPAVAKAMAAAESAGRRGAMARLLAPKIAAKALPVSGAEPHPTLTAPSLRYVLREGGETAAAVAVGRAAERLGAPAVPPDVVERALDHIAEPDWPDAWRETDRADLAELAGRGDRRAAFTEAAIATFALDPRAVPIGAGLSGEPDPREEIEANRAALLAVNALSRLGELVGSSDSSATEAGLRAIKAFRALGWEQEARALALEIAATL